MSEPREAKLYEPPVVCAACGKRLTVAAVTGNSVTPDGAPACSRVCAGYALPTEKPNYKYGSRVDPDAAEPTDSDLEAVA